jgi:fructose-specific phosphotransferase system component IIB
MVLVDNNTGSHKMVGMACLKDFVGYNAEQFAKYFHEIEEIMLTNTMEIRDTEMHRYTPCMDQKDYLARCIKKIKEHGYTKEVKTEAALDMKNEIEDEYIQEADKVIKFFEDYDAQDAFENNIRIYVTGKKPVTRENGFIAYAYVQMNKIMKRQQTDMERKAAKCASSYVGTVGQKITFEGTISMIASYETMYGYTHIYKIVDDNKNVFIWKTNKFIDTTEINRVTVTGTIKEHSEYREEKQTVLTRCKVA